MTSRSSTVKRRRAAKKRLAGDAVLLIGLLYHGTSQSDGLIMRNIFKDGLARAHKLHDGIRRL